MIDPNSTEDQTDLVDLIEEKKTAKIEFRAKITSIVQQMKRFGEINDSDIPLIIEYIEGQLNKDEPCE